MPGSLAGRLLDWDMFSFPEPWFFHPPRFARLLKERWEGICREAASTRRLGELHAARGDFLAVFDQLIAFHKTYMGLLTLQEQLTGRNGPPRGWREELTRSTEELVQLRDEIFSKWHTADDLAKMLVEKFSLSTARLKELAAKHPPPASWFEETGDPFSAE